MTDLSFFDYIKDFKWVDPDFFDSIRFDIANIIYYYGEHFSNPLEKSSHKRKGLKKKIINILLKDYRIYKIITSRDIKKEPKIISNSYFKVNDELRKLGYNVYQPPWVLSYREKIVATFSLLKEIKYFKNFLANRNFNEIFTLEFQNKVGLLKETLKKFYSEQNILALFVPFDLNFFENILIKVFKELQIPSFLFLHGIPAWYNNIDNNRVDYLIVWGEIIKELFIKAGVQEEKILVTGHPYYSYNHVKDLRFDLSDILVITKPISGATSSDRTLLTDRSCILLYLYQIQSALKKFGVKTVRFRPHPSENLNWYLKFLDTSFFKQDSESIQYSLKRSSLVIGPTSTVFIDALCNGVNYLVYEPSHNNLDMLHNEIAPPFDGTYSEIPVAKNEDELISILENKVKINESITEKFIKTPFDIAIVKEFIRK